MKQEFRCQMNNKFEGWAPSDFKHLWSENNPEPRHATVLKTVTVTDHFLALHKVRLFWWEQVCWWLCESSLITSQMDAHPLFFSKSFQTKSQLLNVSKRETCDWLWRRDTFHLPRSPSSLCSKIKWAEPLWKYAPFTPCLWYINGYKMLNAYLSSKENLLPKGKKNLGADPGEQSASEQVWKAVESARSRA